MDWFIFVALLICYIFLLWVKKCDPRLNGGNCDSRLNGGKRNNICKFLQGRGFCDENVYTSNKHSSYNYVDLGIHRKKY